MAKSKKKKSVVVQPENPQSHEREMTKGEASRITNRDSLAAQWLVARDGMDEDTAAMVVASMDAESVLALVEEALLAPAPEAKPNASPKGAEFPDKEPYVDFTTVPQLAADETFPAEAIEMATCASTKNSAEKRYKELKPIVYAKLKAAGSMRSLVGQLQLNAFPGLNKQLSKEKLLEKGVSIDIINQCWTETPFDDIRISWAK